MNLKKISQSTLYLGAIIFNLSAAQASENLECVPANSETNGESIQIKIDTSSGTNAKIAEVVFKNNHDQVDAVLEGTATYPKEGPSRVRVPRHTVKISATEKGNQSAGPKKTAIIVLDSYDTLSNYDGNATLFNGDGIQILSYPISCEPEQEVAPIVHPYPYPPTHCGRCAF